MILSGFLFVLQRDYHLEYFADPNYVIFDGLRALRMVLVYVLIPLWFIYRHGGTWVDLKLIPPSQSLKLNITGGILIYGIVSLVFLRYEIFFTGWRGFGWEIVWVKFFFVMIMASITDLWTRGFILFQLSERYGDTVAIFGQNLIWFIIHIYEIDILTQYISLGQAILMTLFLGIAGDLLALRTKSIFGLMVGHSLLNFMVILGARGII